MTVHDATRPRPVSASEAPGPNHNEGNQSMTIIPRGVASSPFDTSRRATKAVAA